MMLLNLSNVWRSLAIAAALAGSMPSPGNQGQRVRPTVIEVNKTPHGVTYKVDSETAELTPKGNLLYLLNQVRRERGSHVPVIVLLDPRVPIDEIGNVDGTAGKAQLNNLRFFVIDRDTPRMSEIKWGPSIPYSTNPPLP